MSDTGEKGKAAREAMAKLSGTDLAGFEAQLETTKMFYTPKRSGRLRQRAPTWSRPWTSSAPSASSTISRRRRQGQGRVGIAFPTARRWATTNNVKLRFDASLHADGGRRQALTHARRRRGSAASSAGSMNIAPGRAAHGSLLALAAVRADRDRSTWSARRSGARSIPTTSCCRRSARWPTPIRRAGVRARPAHRRDRAVDRHRRKPAAARARPRHRDARSVLRSASRSASCRSSSATLAPLGRGASR